MMNKNLGITSLMPRNFRVSQSWTSGGSLKGVQAPFSRGNRLRQKRSLHRGRAPLDKFRARARVNLIIGIFLTFFTQAQAGPPTQIIVKPNQSKGIVNRNILGLNVLGVASSLKEYDQYSNFGGGLWDEKWNKPTKDPMNLAKEIRVNTLRFPGGCGTHSYDWKKAVEKNRSAFRFGIDEFMRVAGALGAEPVFTVSYFTGGPDDAADLVEYLNAPSEERYPWALKRADKGIQKPYGVKYFEIGNEVDHGNHKNIKNVSPEYYAFDFLEYYDAMKKVDPQAQVGAVLYDSDWNKSVIKIIKDKIDFGIVHIYPTPVWGKGLEKIPVNEIFSTSLALPIVRYDFELKALRVLLRKFSGHDVPVLVTEFNGGFAQDKPVPYRHSLGNALVNAEIIRVLMDPMNNVKMAHYWNFVNEYWGMIANGFNGKYETLNKPYYKRPNFYVFDLYGNHFGNELIAAEVISPGYDIGRYDFYKEFVRKYSPGKTDKLNLLNPWWKIYTVDGIEAKQKNGILTLNFANHQQWNYYHAVKSVEVEPDTFYRLSGYIKTEGLVDNVGVSLEAQDGRGWTRTRSAISTKKIKGTTDWQYVQIIYKTLPDANFVTVLARRSGKIGPLKGRAYFKSVKFEKFTPGISANIPYLAVNASKSADEQTVYLMIINKNLEESMQATIELKDFTPEQKGLAWILNGPNVEATNERNKNNVNVMHKEFDVWSEQTGVKNSFEFTFEPHSLTAFEITRYKQK